MRGIEHHRIRYTDIILAALQAVLDPLQQALASGCHLTRNTLKSITEDVTFKNSIVAPRFTNYKYDKVCI